MAENSPLRPAPALLTEQEVLAHLTSEIAQTSQVEVARRYQISPTQLNDILHGRGGLSKAVLAKLRWQLIRYYRRLEAHE